MTVEVMHDHCQLDTEGATPENITSPNDEDNDQMFLKYLSYFLVIHRKIWKETGSISGQDERWSWKVWPHLIVSMLPGKFFLLRQADELRAQCDNLSLFLSHLKFLRSSLFSSLIPPLPSHHLLPLLPLLSSWYVVICRDDDLLISAGGMFDKQVAAGTHSGCNLTCSVISTWLITLRLRLWHCRATGRGWQRFSKLLSHVSLFQILFNGCDSIISNCQLLLTLCS